MLVVPLMCSREMESVALLSFAETVATGSLNDN
ncbi:unknown [Klebsiella variicola CAG:634]|nr:unknown [Klebsiella variicola CAG:634]